MNYRVVVNYLGRILLLESACMLPALFTALFCREYAALWAFAVSILICAAFGFAFLSVKPKCKSIYARDGFVIVSLSWILISVFGAVPMWLSGAIPSYIDALFETVSGFTTTGATILTDIEILPASVLYWRSFTHWLGGMGVLVFILAFASLSRGSGMSLHILRAESPGPTVDKFAPKTYKSARILYLIYIAMTAAEMVFLMCGGLPFFDALTTSFGTAGTGGFAIRNDSLASYSPYCQTVVAVFMMLFGINFNVYYLLILRSFGKALKNSELRLYISIIAVSSGVIALNILQIYKNFAVSLHQAFFQVVSIITTTGFSTVDFNTWPELSTGILVSLMLIGACAGSTGGGLKVSRVIILAKALHNEIKHLLHPHSVTAVKIDGKPLEKETVDRCGIFFFAFIFIAAVSALLLSIEGNSLKTNLTAVMACINNVGPGLDAVGPVSNYSFFSSPGKLVLMFDMLVGRLELFPILLLFSPSTWKSGR